MKSKNVKVWKSSQTSLGLQECKLLCRVGQADEATGLVMITMMRMMIMMMVMGMMIISCSVATFWMMTNHPQSLICMYLRNCLWATLINTIRIIVKNIKQYQEY